MLYHILYSFSHFGVILTPNHKSYSSYTYAWNSKDLRKLTPSMTVLSSSYTVCLLRIQWIHVLRPFKLSVFNSVLFKAVPSPLCWNANLLISGALATFAFRQRNKVSALPTVNSLTLCLVPTCTLSIFFVEPHSHIQCYNFRTTSNY